jgi:ribosome-associated protein
LHSHTETQSTQKVQDLSGLEIAQKCAFWALEKKAEGVLILDVSKLTSFADYFVICSAPSERQVQAIARNVDDEFRALGKKPLGLEGVDEGHWVLADYGDVIFHAFLDSARQYYDLEGFWADAPRIKPIDPSKPAKASKAPAQA